MHIGVRGSIGGIIDKKLKANSGRLSVIVAKAWRNEVNKSPISQQAKRRYSVAIRPFNKRAGAYITDYVAKIIEKGFESFDMKPGLLKGVLYKRIPVNGKVRTVSIKSPQDSWIHPGVKGANAIERTKKSLRSRLQALVEEALR